MYEFDTPSCVCQCKPLYVDCIHADAIQDAQVAFALALVLLFALDPRCFSVLPLLQYIGAMADEKPRPTELLVYPDESACEKYQRHMDAVEPRWRCLNMILQQPLGVYLFDEHLGKTNARFAFVKAVQSYRMSHASARQTMARKTLQLFIDGRSLGGCRFVCSTLTWDHSSKIPHRL